MIRRIKINPRRGSHLPVLITALRKTQGDVLELGCGIYSTPFIHWICMLDRRRLVTYETEQEFGDYLGYFASDLHIVRFCADVEAVDFSDPWSVVLVDHAPDERRYLTIARLQHAEYVVAHDSEEEHDSRYRYSSIFDLFKYRKRFDLDPSTTVFSNQHDLVDFNL